VREAPGRTLALSKVVIDPGATLPLHYHRGTQVSRIVSGVLHYTVQSGSVVVREGNAEHPRKVRTIKAGQTARLKPGQWLVEQPSDVHRAANRGSKPVVVFLATLLETGAPASTPAN
jgi:quercetin dioxygenase-like cupin family protein